MFHVNLIKITYTIYMKEMKVNQTRHLNYKKKIKEEMKDKKLEDVEKKSKLQQWALSFNS